MYMYWSLRILEVDSILLDVVNAKSGGDSIAGTCMGSVVSC